RSRRGGRAGPGPAGRGRVPGGAAAVTGTGSVEAGGDVRTAPTPGARLRELVAGRRIVVCCGSGGVGKTTTSAVMALEGARVGRRTVVVTIDPAKRLADAKIGRAHV